MKKILDKYKFILVLLVLVIIFFSSSLVLTFDSTHYLTYVNILEGNAPFSSWDIVRGPVFPIILYIIGYKFFFNSQLTSAIDLFASILWIIEKGE